MRALSLFTGDGPLLQVLILFSNLIVESLLAGRKLLILAEKPFL